MEVNSDTSVISQSVQPLGRRSSLGYTFLIVLMANFPLVTLCDRIYYEVIE